MASRGVEEEGRAMERQQLPLNSALGVGEKQLSERDSVTRRTGVQIFTNKSNTYVHSYALMSGVHKKTEV